MSSVAKSGANTLVKAIWVIVLIIFPLIGLILWYLFGPNGYQAPKTIRAG